MKALAWTALVLGMLYFILPLVGMAEFSLSMRRGVYSFDAYASVLGDSQFQRTFTFSVAMAVVTIVFGVLLALLIGLAAGTFVAALLNIQGWRLGLAPVRTVGAIPSPWPPFSPPS